MKARQSLKSNYNTIAKLHLRQLFKEDPGRGERMTAEAEGIFLDYSKNRITRETLDLLLQLAAECGLQSRIDAMFRGEKINVTEDRSVLHVALRAPKGKRIVVDGKDVVSDIHAVLEKDGGFRSTGSKRNMARPHRKADSERRQYRNRRLGSRARHGIRSA